MSEEMKENPESSKEVQVNFLLHFLNGDVGVSGGLESPLEARHFSYSIVLNDITNFIDSIKEKEGESEFYQELLLCLSTIREMALINKKMLLQENNKTLFTEEETQDLIEVDRILDTIDSHIVYHNWSEIELVNMLDKFKIGKLSPTFAKFGLFSSKLSLSDFESIRSYIKNALAYVKAREQRETKKPDMGNVTNLSEEVKKEQSNKKDDNNNNDIII